MHAFVFELVVNRAKENYGQEEFYLLLHVNYV